MLDLCTESWTKSFKIYFKSSLSILSLDMKQHIIQSFVPIVERRSYFTTLVLTHGKAGFSFKHTACQSLCDLFLTVFWPLLEF